jgi:hypothetical protein
MSNGIAMKEKFEQIIKVVADAADLSPCQILCNRKFPETIDARWIAVKLMKEGGFYTSRIADYMGMTTRNVNYILFSVETRLTMGDKALGNILDRARKELRNWQEKTTKNGL